VGVSGGPRAALTASLSAVTFTSITRYAACGTFQIAHVVVGPSSGVAVVAVSRCVVSPLDVTGAMPGTVYLNVCSCTSEAFA
jgi:hypothetical protein